jgi:cytochrome P450
VATAPPPTRPVPRATGPAPTAAGLPVIGSLLDLRRDPLGVHLRARRDRGDVVRFVAGPPGLRAVFHAVYSAEAAQQVLTGTDGGFRKDNAFYGELRDSFGNGLLTSQDEEYVRQRRVVQPLFTQRRVDGYAEAVCDETDRLLDAWEHTAPGTVDLVPEMTRLTLRAVTRILFGAEATGEMAAAIARCFPVISDYALRRAYSPVSPPRHWPTPANRRAAAAHRDLYAVCDRVIARRAEEGGDVSGAPEAPGAPDAPAGTDLLTLLSRACHPDGSPVDAREIRDQTLVFLLAGHETTATSLTFALDLLARHPEAQARAREEVAAVLDGRRPTAADLPRLPYLTMVVKETLRLYPAAPVFGRRSTAETVLGGHHLPAGSDVYVVPFVTHRHPAYWDRPERFDPERFTPEAEAARPRYAWYPFGGGPRACIGRHLSMLEAVLALALVLGRFDLAAPGPEVPVGSAITLRAEAPVPCRITARERRDRAGTGR